MNYIKKLELENEEKENRIEEIQDQVNELRRYLMINSEQSRMTFKVMSILKTF